MTEKSEAYYTISCSGEGLYRDKGSKFISYAFPVSSIDEVRDILALLRKKYYNARHVCYAYVLGPERTEYRSNDDGEPSGTAGRPILGQINSRVLTNVLVVVIRYFGGVLLGTGGLIVAYRESASEALNNAKVIMKQVEEVLTVYFRYQQMNDVMRSIRDQQATIISQEVKMECVVQVLVRLSMAANLKNRLEKLEGVTVDC